MLKDRVCDKIRKKKIKERIKKRRETQRKWVAFEWLKGKPKGNSGTNEQQKGSSSMILSIWWTAPAMSSTELSGQLSSTFQNPKSMI